MRRRVMVDGKPDWTENVPSQARVHGYGGTMVTHAITPMRSPWKRAVTAQRMSDVRGRPRCGRPMPRSKEPCWRRFGHRDDCRSQAAVWADTERRRAAHR